MRPLIVSMSGIGSDQAWTRSLASDTVSEPIDGMEWRADMDWVELSPGRLDMRTAGDSALELSHRVASRTVVFLGLQTALLFGGWSGMEAVRWADDRDWCYVPNQLFSTAWYSRDAHRWAVGWRLVDLWEQRS